MIILYLLIIAGLFYSRHLTFSLLTIIGGIYLYHYGLRHSMETYPLLIPLYPIIVLGTISLERKRRRNARV